MLEAGAGGLLRFTEGFSLKKALARDFLKIRLGSIGSIGIGERQVGHQMYKSTACSED
jgi:hypothetical protein